ncbi:MAG: hypothetical protein KJZ59_05580 [Pararhodobacter sp.]|nr:hypothetical protein [Pararhodobacter sp.]
MLRTGIFALVAVILAAAQSAAAFERSNDPAKFDYLVPLSRKQAFSVQEMYNSETVGAIVQHLSRIAKNRPNDPKAFEVLCQWTYLWWRGTTDKEAKLRIVAAGAYAADRLEALRPGSDEALVWRGTMLSLEGLTKGILNVLNIGPKLRDLLEEGVRRDIHYFYSFPLWSLGRLYYKMPGFPVSSGDIQRSEALLEKVHARETKFNLMALFLAETKAARGKMDEFRTLVASIEHYGWDSYFAKYAHWPVVYEGKALAEVVAAGKYDKYTWDPLLVPYPPPPADW